jgi:hypothetical protein
MQQIIAFCRLNSPLWHIDERDCDRSTTTLDLTSVLIPIYCHPDCSESRRWPPLSQPRHTRNSRARSIWCCTGRHIRLSHTDIVRLLVVLPSQDDGMLCPAALAVLRTSHHILVWPSLTLPPASQLFLKYLHRTPVPISSIHHITHQTPSTPSLHLQIVAERHRILSSNHHTRM